MKPHLWLSVLRHKRGQWACCTAQNTPTGAVRKRILRPNGGIFYGDTPEVAYNNWKEHHVGSA